MEGNGQKWAKGLQQGRDKSNMAKMPENTVATMESVG